MGLTKAQVRDIFAGKITDWGAVGGQPGHQIHVIVREPESSTRSSFESYFFDGAKPVYPNAINVVESKEGYSQIRALKDGIAMVTLQTSTQNDPTMRLLALDGVIATTTNIGNVTYPIRRPVFFFTSVDPAKLKPAVKAFVDFIRAPRARRSSRPSRSRCGQLLAATAAFSHRRMLALSMSAAVRTFSSRLVFPAPSSLCAGSTSTRGGAKKLIAT